MKTVQMTIDEPLLSAVDEVVRTTNTTRSAFMREALQLALQQYRIRQLEQQHALGYQRNPVEAGEFDLWMNEQSWGPE